MLHDLKRSALTMNVPFEVVVGSAADRPGAPSSLGTWTHDGTNFVRHQ